MNWKALVFLMFTAIMLLFSFWMIGKANECPLLCPKSTEINLIQIGGGNKTTEPLKCVEQDCSRFKFIGWAGVVISLAFIGLFIWRSRGKKKIPFSIIKKLYIKSMGKTDKVSINEMALTKHLDENNGRYVFVLQDNHDGIDRYFMCEADMYTGEFGRGYGKYTDKLIEAEHWYVTRAKSDVTQAVARTLGQQAANEMALKTIEQQKRLAQMQQNNNGGGEFH